MIKKILLGLCCLPAASYALLDSLVLTGNPSLFTINTAVAGQQPAPLVNTSTSYSITTVGATRISGKVSASMPANVTLRVSLAASNYGGTSLGTVTLTTTNKNLVTGIPLLTLLSSGNMITYTLTATTGAAKVTNKTATITFTLQ